MFMFVAGIILIIVDQGDRDCGDIVDYGYRLTVIESKIMEKC
jgi:hypothetical protein